MPGKQDHPRRLVEEVGRIAGQHQAPGGGRLGDAEAEEGERGFRQDRLRDEGGEHDQIGRDHVRRHVAEDDAAVGIAGGARGIDIGHHAHRQRGGAHHARDARHDRDGDGDDQVEVDAGERGGANRRDHDQRQHDDRKGQQDVHEALDPVVDPAAEIGRRDAEDRAERRADERRGEADHQRGARAVDDARADVAAEGVGAAPMRHGRRLQAVGGIEADRSGS